MEYSGEEEGRQRRRLSIKIVRIQRECDSSWGHSRACLYYAVTLLSGEGKRGFLLSTPQKKGKKRAKKKRAHIQSLSCQYTKGEGEREREKGE